MVPRPWVSWPSSGGPAVNSARPQGHFPTLCWSRALHPVLQHSLAAPTPRTAPAQTSSGPASPKL